MKTLIVSCLEQVPHLVERFHPDRLLSISAIPKTPGYMQRSHHRVLNFADIDTPTRTNLRFAAKPEDIEVIRSLKDDETVLINCRLGQRRSPTAALIVLWALYPGREPEWVERIHAQAPYVEFNRWMLRLADPQRASRVQNRPRVLPPKGCFLVLEPDAMDGSKDPRSE